MDTRDSLSNRIATALVQRAARHAPAVLRERLGEEWLADLAAQRAGLARLRFALGCLWARQVIARDPLWSRAPARSAAVARGHAGTLGALVAPPPSPLPRRTLVVLAIVALHVAAIGAFVHGVKVPPRVIDPGPIVARFFPHVPPKEPPPPVVRATLEKVLVVDPLVHPQFTLPQVLEAPQVIETLPQAREPSATTRVNRLPGGPGAGFPSADEFYPAGAIRLGESGVAAVRVCVDPRGRLVADPVIATSSGSARLDGGALALARAGSGHYRSATEDGKPVPACFALRVRFALRS